MYDVSAVILGVTDMCGVKVVIAGLKSIYMDNVVLEQENCSYVIVSIGEVVCTGVDAHIETICDTKEEFKYYLKYLKSMLYKLKNATTNK